MSNFLPKFPQKCGKIYTSWLSICEKCEHVNVVGTSLFSDKYSSFRARGRRGNFRTKKKQHVSRTFHPYSG